MSLFERECDNLRNQSPHLLNTYLALMQPLSFSRRENLVAPISLARSIDILESQRDHTAKTTFSEIVAEQKLLETSNYNANVDQTDPSRSPLDAMDAMDAMDQGPWISKETEKKLLIDLIYILQVTQCTQILYIVCYITLYHVISHYITLYHIISH